jgi:hypothetical protein
MVQRFSDLSSPVSSEAVRRGRFSSGEGVVLLYL